MGSAKFAVEGEPIWAASKRDQALNAVVRSAAARRVALLVGWPAFIAFAGAAIASAVVSAPGILATSDLLGLVGAFGLLVVFSYYNFYSLVRGAFPEVYRNGLRVVNQELFSRRNSFEVPFSDVQVLDRPASGFVPGGPARDHGWFDVKATVEGRLVYRARFFRHILVHEEDVDQMFDALQRVTTASIAPPDPPKRWKLWP